jgi:hypothetical protein
MLLVVTYGLVRYVSGGIWHIFTKPFAWARRALFGQVKHTYHTV